MLHHSYPMLLLPLLFLYFLFIKLVLNQMCFQNKLVKFDLKRQDQSLIIDKAVDH